MTDVRSWFLSQFDLSLIPKRPPPDLIQGDYRLS